LTASVDEPLDTLDKSPGHSASSSGAYPGPPVSSH